MDGHVNNSSCAASFHKEISAHDEQELENADLGRDLDSDFVALEDNLKHNGILDDDFEQPDGQHISSRLDDDGGTHFEAYSNESVIGQEGSLKDVNVANPTLQGESGDNAVVFNSERRPDFGDNIVGADNDNDNVDFGYLLDKPVESLSDIAEHGASGGISVAQVQPQNYSTLLEGNGDLACGYNLLQSHMTLVKLRSPENSCLVSRKSIENEAVNLCDSLEKDEENNNFVVENNTSGYISADSVSLVVDSFPVQDNDSIWSQYNSSDHGGCLSTLEQNFHSNHGMEQNLPRHISPPWYFQEDSLSRLDPNKMDTGFVREAHKGGYGDFRETERDNTNVFTIELSDEGLSGLYAQAVTASTTVATPATSGICACKGDMAMSLDHSQTDWASGCMPIININQQGCFEGVAKSLCQESLNSQPRNEKRKQGLLKDESKASGYGDEMDTCCDERQAAAGSPSKVNQNPASDTNESAKRPSNSEHEAQRTAIIGSSSFSDHNIIETVNPLHSSSVSSRKVALRTRSGSRSGRGSTGMWNDKSDGEQASENKGAVSSGHNSLSLISQHQVCVSSLTPHTNSHIYTLNATNADRRVSGVGKESNTQASAPQVAVSHVVKAEPYRPMTMAQRLDRAHTCTALSVTQTVKPSHSSAQILQPQQQHSQLPYSFDRSQLAADHQTELHTFRSSNEHISAVLNFQHSHGYHESHMSGANNHSSGDPHLLVDEKDIQHNHISGGTDLGSRNPLIRIQQHHLFQHECTKQHIPDASQQMSHHQEQEGQQTTCSQGVGSSGSEECHHNCTEETITMQMKVFEKQEPSFPSEPNYQHSHLDNDIQGMEEMQGHLHSMLYLGTEASLTDQTVTAADLLLSEQPVDHQLCFDVSTSSFMGNNHQDDMLDILENFPSFSSKLFTSKSGLANSKDRASHEENKYLRDSLEKERYRRKHCEDHILKQNAKLLDVQQQLAVVVSTSKRKDIMIEQLDKQLAKFVEGWKKKEAEKDEVLRVLRQEKEQNEETLQSQQAMINKFERELSQNFAELKEEKARSAKILDILKNEVHQAQREKELAEQALKAEREKYADVITEWDNLKDSKELAEKRAQEAEDKLMQEQNSALKKEQELLGKIHELKEANQRMIDIEMVKLEEQKKEQVEAEIQIEELKAELKKSVEDVEQMIREKESQKDEMAAMEAKFENEQKKLEADFCAEVEKKISDQAAEFFSRLEASLEEAAKCHHQQVEDLNSKHQCDMQQQAAVLNEEMQKKEDSYQKQLKELEEKLQDMRNENTLLKQSKIKLESQRMEVLKKLQFMMQSQWNEAISLLVSTPQKKQNSITSLVSSQSSDQSASAMAITDGSASVTDLNMVTPLPELMSHASTNEYQDHQYTHSLQYSPCTCPAVLEKEQVQGEEEIGRMGEIVKRLGSNMYMTVTGKELEVTEMSPASQSNALSFTLSKSSDAVLQHQHLCQQEENVLPSELESVKESGKRDDFHIQWDNPSLSDLTHAHVQGYVTSPRGKTFITTSSQALGDHMEETKSRYHTLSVRSPQTSSPLYSSESSYSSVNNGSEQPPLPGSNHDLCMGHFGRGCLSPHHIDQHDSLLWSQSHSSSCSHFASNLGSVTSPRMGDSCDNIELKVVTGSATSTSLDNLDRNTYFCSPTSSNHWSPSSVTTVQHRPNVPMMTSAVAGEPGWSTASRPHYAEELSANRHRAITGQHLARNNGRLNESFSSPTRQTSVGNHFNKNNGSSGCNDPISLQANQSPLSDQTDEPQSRHGELQHYIRLLLQKEAGSVCSEPETTVHFSDESSAGLTDFSQSDSEVELTAWLSQLQDPEQQEWLREFSYCDKEDRRKGDEWFDRVACSANSSRAVPGTNSRI